MAKKRAKRPLNERRTTPKTDAEIEHCRYVMRAWIIYQAALAKMTDRLLLSLVFEMCCEIVSEIEDDESRNRVISGLHQAMIEIDAMKVGPRKGNWLPRFGKAKK